MKRKSNSQWRYFQWRCLRLRKLLLHSLCSKLYLDTDGDIRKSIIVAGTARSGTTWLADIIASQISCRMMFEPFHSRKVKAFGQFNYFQYMRPAEESEELRSYCARILRGDIRHTWIDRQVENIFPKYRLIKEIRVNLFLKWIHNRFPDVPLLFLIRHPCAVVLSRMQLGWATDTDIEPFLSQTELVDDFLGHKMDIIERARTVEEKHAIIWCVSNLIPIKQFQSNGLNVVFYENLCTQPEAEIPRIFQALRHHYQASAFQYLDQPSTTTLRSSAILTGDNKVSQWKKELLPTQIDSILSVVQEFGLDNLYGDSLTPRLTSEDLSSDLFLL